MMLDEKISPPAGSAPRFFALIPCAGTGQRALGKQGGLTGPKQYQLLHGKPMVWHTLQAFREVPAVAAIWVVVSQGDNAFHKACEDFKQAHEVVADVGGATRAQSVANGLKALMQQAAKADDWVLVHDAARCLITPAQITALIDACKNDVVGGLLAQPLPDTLKTGNVGRVASTIDRSDKYLAQTPQMFRIGGLLAALEAAGDAVTDESSAMEAQGLKPLLVPGNAQNFKVTYPEDFDLAEAILQSRMKAENDH
jgi:2-C-methyl-D-erythritol 4-phosphate cytidylyltransferase